MPLYQTFLEECGTINFIFYIAHEQSLCITLLKAALHPWPSSSSTPRREPLWTEVVVRGRKRTSDSAVSPPRLSLYNCFEALSQFGVAQAHSGPCRLGDAATSSPLLGEVPEASRSGCPASSSVAGGAWSHPTQGLDHRPPSGSSIDFNITPEATEVGSDRTTTSPPQRCDAPGQDNRQLPPHLPGGWTTTLLPPRRDAPAQDTQSWTSHPPGDGTTNLPPCFLPGQQQLVGLTMCNAVTHCFPGATVPVLLDKLPGLLQSLPSFMTRVIVHVGTNDTTRKQ